MRMDRRIDSYDKANSRFRNFEKAPKIRSVSQRKYWPQLEK
jgi:hypothetical protein